MGFLTISYVPILAAAVAGWFAGAVWYGVLGKVWMRAAGLTKEAIEGDRGRPSFVPFVVSFLAEIVMAAILAGVLWHMGNATLRTGMISAALLWAGFVATTILVNNAYQMRPLLLTVIDAGHWLLVLLIMGAILGAWGVR